MSVNTYQQPRLIIGHKEYSQFGGVNINFPGNSKINSMSFTLNDSDAQEGKFLNKEVKFYLNYGSEDSVPIFRGFIRQFKPSDKDIKITAYDGRTFIQGKEAQTISLTDKDNFDGFTVAQYLSHLIQDKVNLNDMTRIGLDALTDVSPPVLMKGVRGKNQSPYNLATKQLKNNTDKESINDGIINNYNIDMIEDGNISNIVLVKDKNLDSTPSATFAYLDGIESYTHKVRATPSYITAETTDGKTTFYKDGNLPQGLIGKTIKGKYEDTASATEAALFEVISSEKNTTEISLKVTKGFDISLGSIVRLVVPEDELANQNHRVASKRISISDRGTTCTLNLNRRPVEVADYISSS
tara:strand:+ start:350 stop:1411 length:1062 start_codon:yes stop_codon:yes gene_type:complete